MPKVILLAGPPSRNEVIQSLSREADARHVVGLDARLDARLGPQRELVKDSFPPPLFETPARASTNAPGAAWRLIHPQQGHLPSGLTQDAYLPRSALGMGMSARSRPRRSFGDMHDTDVSFLTVTSASTPGDGAPVPGPDDDDDEEDGDEDADLERSFSLHVDPAYSETKTWNSLLEATQPNESTPPPPPSSPSDRRRKRRRHRSPASSLSLPLPAPTKTIATTRQKLGAVRTTPLSSAPSASQIRQMHPHTITANLLVAIVAIEPLRTITPARTGRPVDLAELHVADHTCAQPALHASFWLDRDQRRDTALRAALAPLRTGDVVLLQRVALRQFRGAVTAQSLGRRAGSSAVALLWRRGHAVCEGDGGAPAYDSDALGEGVEGEGAFETHLRRVREWALRSIAPPVSAAEQVAPRRPRTRAVARAETALPPDESQGDV